MDTQDGSAGRCPQCGAPVVPGASFCSQCGARFGAGTGAGPADGQPAGTSGPSGANSGSAGSPGGPGAGPVGASAAGAAGPSSAGGAAAGYSRYAAGSHYAGAHAQAGGPQAQQTPRGAYRQASQAGNQQPPQPGYPPQQAYAPRPDWRQGAPSPLKRGWDDFKASDAKLLVVLKLALFRLLPGVGSLVTDGYLYSWGRACALGREDPMPRKLVRPGVLDSGLYVYGTSLILEAALLLAAVILTSLTNAIHLGWLGILLALALAFFARPFILVASMRTALCGRVRSGLALDEVWRMFSSKGRFGSLLVATWVPALALMLASSLISLLFVLLMGASLAAVGGASLDSIAGAFSYDASYGTVMAVSAVMGVFSAFVPLSVIAAFCTFFASVAASAVSVRAAGYWIRDFQPASWPDYQESLRAGTVADPQ